VRFDNHLFKKELVEEIPRDKKRGGFTSPASPSKRLNRSSSVDSMATNAASAGDLDDDMRDAPFDADEDPFTVGNAAVVNKARLDLVDTSVPETVPPTQIYYGDSQQPDPTETQSAPPELNGYSGSSAEASTYAPATATHQLPSSILPDEAVRSAVAEDGPAPPTVPRSVKTFPIAPGPPQRQTSTDSDTKLPEMQERGGATSPFLLQGQGNGRPAASMDMELDERAHEAQGGDDH
jgi:hypothetical protein